MECGGRTMAGECEELELAVIGKCQNRGSPEFEGRIEQSIRRGSGFSRLRDRPEGGKETPEL